MKLISSAIYHIHTEPKSFQSMGFWGFGEVPDAAVVAVAGLASAVKFLFTL